MACYKPTGYCRFSFTRPGSMYDGDEGANETLPPVVDDDSRPAWLIAYCRAKMKYLHFAQLELGA